MLETSSPFWDKKTKKKEEVEEEKKTKKSRENKVSGNVEEKERKRREQRGGGYGCPRGTGVDSARTVFRSKSQGGRSGERYPCIYT